MTIHPVYIQQPKLIESSGICRSNIDAMYLSHNDGADSALYRFDAAGNAVGILKSAMKTTDFEDTSSAIVNGVPTIILGDFGDNTCTRSSYKIIVVREDGSALTSNISFTYPDGKKRNCEACALLPNGVIVLVTKAYPAQSGPTQVFTIRSWLSDDKSTTVTAGPVLSKSMANITSMDTYEDRFVLLGNQHAYFFDLSWKSFGNIALPKSFQPEGLCYAHDGESLLMTSEVDKTKGGLTPLWTIPL